jgi:hypothetical protein
LAFEQIQNLTPASCWYICSWWWRTFCVFVVTCATSSFSLSQYILHFWWVRTFSLNFWFAVTFYRSISGSVFIGRFWLITDTLLVHSKAFTDVQYLTMTFKLSLTSLHKRRLTEYTVGLYNLCKIYLNFK